jgi:hypothetical protein
MLAFIDESGDTGLMGRKGTSEYFTLVIVYFPDMDDADTADRAINQIKLDLVLNPKFEFHFSRICNRFREAFFSAASSMSFFYVGFVVSKAMVHESGFRDKSSFYKWVCGTVVEHAKPYLHEAIVKIDRSGNRDFQREFCAYLKRRISDHAADFRYVKKVSMESSATNNLLQLADMVCGAVARSHRKDRNNDRRFIDKIAHLQIDVRYWPDS